MKSIVSYTRFFSNPIAFLLVRILFLKYNLINPISGLIVTEGLSSN